METDLVQALDKADITSIEMGLYMAKHSRPSLSQVHTFIYIYGDNSICSDLTWIYPIKSYSYQIILYADRTMK